MSGGLMMAKLDFEEQNCSLPNLNRELQSTTLSPSVTPSALSSSKEEPGA